MHTLNARNWPIVRNVVYNGKRIIQERREQKERIEELLSDPGRRHREARIADVRRQQDLSAGANNVRAAKSALERAKHKLGADPKFIETINTIVLAHEAACVALDAACKAAESKNYDAMIDLLSAVTSSAQAVISLAPPLSQSSGAADDSSTISREPDTNSNTGDMTGCD